MAEHEITINPIIRELLTSQSPNLALLDNGKTSTTVTNEGQKAILEATELIRGHGRIPFDRLHLNNQRILIARGPNPTSSGKALFVKEYPEGRIAFVDEVSSVSPEERCKELLDWVEKSPLRELVFPFEERLIRMIIMHRESEEIVSLKAKFLLAENVQKLPLPELALESCVVGFRTDAWVNDQSRRSKWLAVPLSQSTVRGTTPFNRNNVDCIKAMVQLGQRHFNR